jgi:hypothetical protein
MSPFPIFAVIVPLSVLSFSLSISIVKSFTLALQSPHRVTAPPRPRTPGLAALFAGAGGVLAFACLVLALVMSPVLLLVAPDVERYRLSREVSHDLAWAELLGLRFGGAGAAVVAAAGTLAAPALARWGGAFAFEAVGFWAMREACWLATACVVWPGKTAGVTGGVCWETDHSLRAAAALAALCLVPVFWAQLRTRRPEVFAVALARQVTAITHMLPGRVPRAVLVAVSLALTAISLVRTLAGRPHSADLLNSLSVASYAAGFTVHCGCLILSIVPSLFTAQAVAISVAAAAVVFLAALALDSLLLARLFRLSPSEAPTLVRDALARGENGVFRRAAVSAWRSLPGAPLSDGALASDGAMSVRAALREWLRQLARHPDLEVRTCAALVIGDLLQEKPDSPDFMPLIPILRHMLRDMRNKDDMGVKSAVCSASGFAGSTERGFEASRGLALVKIFVVYLERHMYEDLDFEDHDFLGTVIRTIHMWLRTRAGHRTLTAQMNIVSTLTQMARWRHPKVKRPTSDALRYLEELQQPGAEVVEAVAIQELEYQAVQALRVPRAGEVEWADVKTEDDLDRLVPVQEDVEALMTMLNQPELVRVAYAAVTELAQRRSDLLDSIPRSDRELRELAEAHFGDVDHLLAHFERAVAGTLSDLVPLTLKHPLTLPASLAHVLGAQAAVDEANVRRPRARSLAQPVMGLDSHLAEKISFGIELQVAASVDAKPDAFEKVRTLTDEHLTDLGTILRGPLAPLDDYDVADAVLRAYQRIFERLADSVIGSAHYQASRKLQKKARKRLAKQVRRGLISTATRRVRRGQAAAGAGGRRAGVGLGLRGDKDGYSGSLSGSDYDYDDPASVSSSSSMYSSSGYTESSGASGSVGDEELRSETVFAVLAFVEKYGRLLEELGEDPGLCERVFDLSEMKRVYVSRSAALMSEWCDRIVALEPTAEIEVDERSDHLGQLYTSCHIDVFRIANDQVIEIETKAPGGPSGDLVRRLLTRSLAQNGINMLKRYQEGWMALLEERWRSFTLERLIAQVNNAFESCEFADEFVGTLRDQLGLAKDEDLLEEADGLIGGFQRASKLCVSLLVDHFLVDCRPAVKRLLTAGWIQTDAMGPIIATVFDYLDDARPRLNSYHAGRLLAECLERIVIVYVEIILYRQELEIDGQVADRLFEDIELLEKEFTRAGLPQAQLSVQLRVLFFIHDVLAAEPDDVLDAFLELKELEPGATAQDLECLLSQRVDLSAAKREKILARYARGHYDTAGDQGDEGQARVKVFTRVKRGDDGDGDGDDYTYESGYELRTSKKAVVANMLPLVRAYHEQAMNTSTLVRMGDFLRDNLGLNVFQAL